MGKEAFFVMPKRRRSQGKVRGRRSGRAFAVRPYLERAQSFSLEDLAELREQAVKEARERPLLTLALAFVAGVIFGISMSRR